MAYNETGHARNAASFDEIITVVKSLGVDYNPAADMIKIGELEALKSKLEEKLLAINEKTGIYKDKIYARQNAYEKMSTLAARIVNTMIGLGIDQKIQTQAKNTLTKIRGGKSKKKTDSAASADTAVKSVSVSQMSFDQRKNNFSSLVELAAAQSQYIPNENDVKIISLRAYLNLLQTLNQEADQASHDLTVARQNRDNILYAKDSGVLLVAQRIKAYVKGAFGAQSAKYNRIKGIKFTVSGSKS